MFFNRSSVSVCIVMLLTSASLWAHPGHGATESDSVQHYLIEPTHGGWVFLLGGLLVGLWLFAHSCSKKVARLNEKDHRGH